MPTPAPFRLPVRARRACRVGLPVLLSSALVAGALVVAGGSAADAAAQTGTYTIGDTPIPLNQASDPEIGVLAPSADAATAGMFGAQQTWPMIPLHAALTRTGNIVSYGSLLTAYSQAGLQYDQWNVARGFDTDAHTQTDSMGQYDGFCDAIVELPDSRLLMVGGNSDTSSMIYDPATGGTTMESTLSQPRWYGTSIRTEDDRILVLGGVSAYNSSTYLTPDDETGVGYTPEIGTGTSGWTQLTGASSTDFFGAVENHWWYPRAFNGPAGTVVGFSDNEIWSLDPAGTGAVQRIGTLPYHPLVSGSQVMYAPGEVLVAGGGEHINSDDAPGTAAAATFDVATGASRAAQPMHSARNWLNLTVLPTGLVWANGGTTVGMGLDDPAQSVKQSETWDPATGQWALAATAQRTRTYHSTSLLLPSGAVLTGGGGVPGPENNNNVEMYYPAYLFTKAADGSVQWAARPAITGISGSATYGGTISMTVQGTIASASLITSPSVTHAQDTDQRRIPLDVQQQGDTVTATLPASAADMPPGDYELSVVNSAGVPSSAQMITIRLGQAGQVTVGATTQVKDPAGSAPYTVSTAAAEPAATGGGAGAGAGGGAPITGIGAGGTAGAGAGALSGAPSGSGSDESDASAGSVAIRLDSSVGLEPVDQLGSRIALSGSTAALQPVGGASPASRRSATSWIVRTGLASSGGISLESAQRPGYFLAADPRLSGGVQVLRYASSSAFAARATFQVSVGAVGQNTSLRLWADRSLWLRHSGNSLVLQHLDTSAKGRYQSSFAVVAGYSASPSVWLTDKNVVSLGSSSTVDGMVRASGTGVAMQRVVLTSSWTARDQATWIVHASGSGIRFESRDRRGWYLATSSYGTGALVLARGTESASFRARSTFTASAGLAGRGRTLRLAGHHDLVVTQAGSSLRVVKPGTTAAARAAASLIVHTGFIRGR